MADSSSETPEPEVMSPVQVVAVDLENNAEPEQQEAQDAAVNNEEAADQVEVELEEGNNDVALPATPSKTVEPTEAPARVSVDDSTQFQDVELSESHQEQDVEQQLQQPQQQEPAPSAVPTQAHGRPHSDTVSTANGHAAPTESPARPNAAPVRPSRASSTYSTRTASTSAAGRKPLLQGVLVVSAYETILNSKDARRTPALKEAAQRALDILKAPTSQSSSVHTGEDRRREVFEPLRLACDTKTNAIMITALDAIGKLVSYGFFNPPSMESENIQEEGDETVHNDKPTSSTEQSDVPDEDTSKLSDLVIDTICDCFIEAPPGPAAAALQAATSNTATPDAVNLQIVKAILTIVLQESNHGLSIHQSSLLKAVRTVYNIFLLSKSPTNQMVAQGALNQIVGSVFNRVRPDPKLAASAAASVASPRMSMSRSNSRMGARTSVNGTSTGHLPDMNGAAGQHNENEETVEVESNKDQNDEEPRRSTDTVRPVQQADQEVDPELETGRSADETAPGSNGQNGAPRIAVDHTDDMEAEDQSAQTSSQRGSISLPNFARLSAMESKEALDGLRTPGLEAQQPFFSLNELHTKDAYLVFRALCKLGMKPLGVESERDMKSHAMRSKLLSLHLILSILQSHMHLFNDPNVVIYSANAKEFQSLLQTVKQYLLLCLSRNAVSSVLSVFELSCEIFWRCIHGLRTKLKKEIEVLMNEIFLPILEMRNSSLRQKAVLLSIFGRLCLDPQALVELYINYDCDRASLDNLYERLVNIISRVSTTQFNTVTPAYHPKEGKDGKDLDSNAASAASWTMVMPYLPPVPATSATFSAEVTVPYFGQPLANANHTIETQLKRQSLDCLVSILHSLVAWAGRPAPTALASLPNSSSTTALQETGTDSPMGGSTSRNSEDDADRSGDLSRDNMAANGSTPSLPTVETFDDPGRFETAKLRKTTLIEGIKKFNYKPKRGIQFLIEHGFIRSKQPRDVAQFLLSASDGLSKAMIGEYLGEADTENVATMHAFVDLMDFHHMQFTDALRTFLQSFRLPGEAQKIDRYMLKFAERYIAQNPGVFADADTAYILAFATIMLNTDAHSPQIKKNRMTKAEFLKNNRGINNGKDLPDELLSDIYDEIVSNEIKMKDEHEGAAGVSSPATGLAGALSYVGRDLQREAYVAQSEGMATKTEAMFRTMVKSQRRGTQRTAGDIFFSASHVEHVRPMFEVVWMPLLAGISGPLQESDDSQVVERSLDGFRQAIKVVCLFDLELERNAFVSTLHKYTLLNDFSAMRPKNVDAIRCLLEVAAINGNYFKSSWREVIVCVSQLERFQLVARGVDSGALPEFGRKHSVTSTRASAAKPKSGRPTEEVALETLSAQITNAADRVFSMSSTLSGTAIVDFVRALSEVSWEEIQSSGLAEHPRVFCLQKLVEIAYYNMNRIRLEWSQMWAILGDHFNQVCCHTNANVSFLALDSLRQLAMRFLEKQELQNFNFQKDFLKPFEYAMVHNNNPDARDMILSCMQQMIQARVHNLRSGWRTMFGVFCAASRVQTERVANQAFDIVKDLYKNQFSLIVVYGSFADLAVCITDFCKISKYQKISLHAIEMLRGLIPQMLNSPECPVTDSGPPPKSDSEGNVDDAMTRFWFPVLFGFYDIIMNGEDLEVRKRALDYLFDTLKRYGHSFPTEFWDSVCKEVLFPIFAVLRSRSDVSRLSTHEEMSVWFSTTMIQALRDLVDLFTYYFDVLIRMLDPLLALLVECICQENDTLARIGTSCLQQLLEKNVHKLTPELWEKIVTTFVQLFQTTTATQLFDENLRVPLDPDTPDPDSQANGNGFVHPTPLPDTSAPASVDPSRATRPLGFSERRRIFRQIIVKCVLQLLLIETAHDLLQNEEVYATIPPADLLRLMAELDHSYRFAKRFNADKDLRLALWKVGFMKQLPNLLKQESSSAATLVNVLLRMHSDNRPDHVAKRQETIDAFLPLGIDILEGYIALDAESQARNISAWTPVVAEVLQGICSWDDATLQAHVAVIYPLAVDLMARDMTQEIRDSVRSVFHRVGLALNIFQIPEGSVAGSEVDDDDEVEVSS